MSSPYNYPDVRSDDAPLDTLPKFRPEYHDLGTKWVEALRSGEYKQGTGRLFNRSRGSYCCLGVLCKVAVDAGVQLDADLDLDLALKPEDMVKLFELDRYTRSDGQMALTRRNDGWNGPQQSFKQIARLVERRML